MVQDIVKTCASRHLCQTPAVLVSDPAGAAVTVRWLWRCFLLVLTSVLAVSCSKSTQPGATPHDVLAESGERVGGRYPAPPPEFRAPLEAVVVQRIRQLLDTNLATATRQEALYRLALDPKGGRSLVELQARGRLPSEMLGDATAWIYRNPDANVRAEAGQNFPRLSRTGERYPPLETLARMSGDANRGKSVYSGPNGSCHKCHVFRGTGTQNGPELTRIADKLDRRGLYDAILNPSGNLVEHYETWLITLTNQDVFCGFLLEDADPIVLRESTAQERRIRVVEVASRQRLEASLMPENTAELLTVQEVVDLVEYLRSQGEPSGAQVPADAQPVIR